MDTLSATDAIGGLHGSPMDEIDRTRSMMVQKIDRTATNRPQHNGNGGMDAVERQRMARKATLMGLSLIHI